MTVGLIATAAFAVLIVKAFTMSDEEMTEFFAE